jgi:hypothetical protein
MRHRTLSHRTSSHRTSSHRTFASRLRAGLAALFAVTVLALPAQAADPVYPLGSRIGLVPPAGMAASDEFSGFADQAKDAVILLAVLPADAFSQIEKTMDADALKKQGITLDKREPVQLGIGKAFLFTGREVAEKTHYRKWLLVAAMGEVTALVNVQAPESSAYSEQVVRAALMTLSLRATIPDAEQLSLLPFTVGELAGFHVNRVLRGRALMLSDAPSESAKDAAKDVAKDAAKDAAPAGIPAHLLIAAVPGGPTEADDRGKFARLAFGEIAGLRDVHLTMSEPLRIGRQSGYQTMAEAKDAGTGVDVQVVQWLRFGSGGFLQMVGVGPTDNWTNVLARLRTVRDSIDPK